MEAGTPKKRIAVTGATGRIGSRLVEILEARGHDVVPISRSNGVDVITGDGLAKALDGVEVIIDAATQDTPDQDAATEFFTTSAANLQRAGAEAGVERIVLISIIGIDKFEGGYNAAKLAQENALIDGPVPVRILRASQFHEFVEQFVGWVTQDGVSHVPAFRTQPIAARAAAEGLADAAEESEVENGRITEIAGPREERLAELAKALFASRGDDLRVEESTQQGDHDAEQYATGSALPNPGAKLAGPSYEAWLKEAVHA